MNAPPPLVRPLQVLAVLLGAAVIALFTAWLRMDAAAAPSSVRESSAAGPDASVTAAAAGGAAAPAVPAAPAPESADRAATPASGAERAVLYGLVTSAGGDAIRDGVLWLFRDDGAHVGTDSLRDGTYSFAGLDAGRYRLRSRIADELALDREVDVAAPTTRLDVELPARWLLTVNAVTPAGEPLASEVGKTMRGGPGRLLMAAAFAEPPATDLPLSAYAEFTTGVATFRGSDPFRMRGEKALPRETVGVLTMPADRPVTVALLLRSHIVAQQPASPGQDVLTFTLAADAFLRELATVRVRVVDAHGAPVAGARVALNDAQTGGGGQPTGDDGRITVSHLVPGRLDLEISHQELRAPMVQVDVPPGADLDLGDVVLAPGTRVEVAMDNFVGKGAVRFNLLDPLPPGRTCKDGYVSRENGATWPLDVYPGRYGFFAAAENGVAIAELDLRTPPAGPLRFDLQPGASLRIDNRVGSGFARLDLRTPGGVVVRRRELSGTSVELVRVPPGSYVAEITDQSGAVARREVTVAAAGATLVVP